MAKAPISSILSAKAAEFVPRKIEVSKQPATSLAGPNVDSTQPSTTAGNWNDDSGQPGSPAAADDGTAQQITDGEEQVGEGGEEIQNKDDSYNKTAMRVEIGEQLINHPVVTSNPVRLLMSGTPDDVIIGHDKTVRDDGTGVSVNLITTIDEDFVSSLTVEYVVSFAVDGEIKTERMRLKFHYNTIDPKPESKGKTGNIGNGLALKNLDALNAETRAELIEAFEFPADAFPAPTNALYIAIHPLKGHPSNMFTLKTYNDPAIDNLVSQIRQYHENNGTINIIASGEALDEIIESIVENANARRTKHYLLDFFKANRIDFPLGVQPNEPLDDLSTLGFAPLPQSTFDSIRDAVFFAYLSQVNEQKIVDNTFSQSQEVNVRIMSIPYAAERRYFVHIELEVRPEFHIGVGDILKLNMGKDGNDPFDEVSVKVTKYSQMQSIGDVVGYFTMAYDKEKQSFKKLEDLGVEQVMDSTAWEDVDQARTDVREQKSKTGYLSATPDSKSFTLVRKALQKFEDRVAGTRGELIFTAKDLSRPDNVVDMYGDLNATPEQLDGALNELISQVFSREQTLALSMLRKAMLGVVLISGAAGTGKSFFVAHAFQPVLAYETKAGARNQVLVVANLHEPLNSLTKTFKTVTNEYRARRSQQPAVIVRLHSFNTEQAMFMSESEQVRGHQPGDRPSIIQYDDKHEVDALAVLKKAARIVFEEHRNATKQTVITVDDPRLKLVEDSLGAYALVRAGLASIPGAKPDFFQRKKQHSGLRYSLDLYTKGKSPGDETLTKQVRDLLCDVLANCDVIVTTVSAALIARVGRAFRPEYLVVEESSKITLAEHMAIISSYQTIKMQIMLGDTKQGSPFTISTAKNNGMFAVSRYSELTRMSHAGFDTARFANQRRYVTDIADLVSNIFYADKLNVDASRDSAEEAVEFSGFLKEQFNLHRSHLVLVDVSESHSFKLGGTSKLNEQHAVVICMIVKSLLASGWKPQQIGCLAPYTAQVNTVSRCIQGPVAEAAQQDLTDLRVLSFDGSQGEEFDVTLVDFTTTGGLGFLQDEQRILVGMSRSKFGLVVIANVRELQKANGYVQSKIGQVIRYMKAHNLVVAWNKDLDTAMIEVMPTSSKNADRKAAAKTLDVETKKVSGCFNCGDPSHSRSACPEPVVTKCKVCAATDHIALSCPNATCKRCGETGHRKADCNDERFCKKCPRCGGRHEVQYCLAPTPAERAEKLEADKQAAAAELEPVKKETVAESGVRETVAETTEAASTVAVGVVAETTEAASTVVGNTASAWQFEDVSGNW